MKALVDSHGKLLVGPDGKLATDACASTCCAPPACGETCTARNLSEVSQITISLAIDLSTGNDNCTINLNRTFSHTWTRINHIFLGGSETIGADQFVFYQEPNPNILPDPGCLRTLIFHSTFDLAASESLEPGDGFECPEGFDPDFHSGDGTIGFSLDVSPPIDSCQGSEGRFGDIQVSFGAECAFIDSEEPHDPIGCGTFKDPFLGNISYPYFAENLTGTFTSESSDSGTDFGGTYSYTATLTITIT